MICKYGEVCSSYLPCKFHKQEAVLDLQKKELEVKERQAMSRSSFFSESADERDERIAREAQARIEQRAERRRLAAESLGDPSPGVVIGLGLGALVGAIIGAVAESSDDEKSKKSLLNKKKR